MKMSVVSNVVCPVCGCCCDDVELVIRDNRIVEARKACALSAAKFESFDRHRNRSPLVRKNGRLVEVSLTEAVRRSAEILAESSYPVFYAPLPCLIPG